METIGFPRTTGIIRAMAMKITTASFLGQNWIYAFLKRNREIKLSRLLALEIARRRVTPSSVNLFFDRFQSIKKKYAILDENI
jgi:hypothetical protein